MEVAKLLLLSILRRRLQSSLSMTSLLPRVAHRYALL
jgi:hypothetical protein